VVDVVVELVDVVVEVVGGSVVVVVDVVVVVVEAALFVQPDTTTAKASIAKNPPRANNFERPMSLLAIGTAPPGAIRETPYGAATASKYGGLGSSTGVNQVASA
jgi:hypothetical protein